MKELIGTIVLLKQPNFGTAGSFNMEDTENPHWNYTEVLLVDIINDNTQATVRHPGGLETYPDLDRVFVKPNFQSLESFQS